MNRKVAVFFNGAYKDNPGEYPRQIGRLKSMHRELRKLQAEPRFLPVYFNGQNVNEIHGNLAFQVRQQLSGVLGDKLVFFGGDGFMGAMINAMGEVKEALSKTEPALVELIDQNPILAAKGGSLNLLNKRLGGDREGGLEDFVEGIDIARVATKRRVLEIAAVDRDNPRQTSYSLHYPFSFFAGTGTDALMVKLQEDQSRATHWAWNVAKITAQAVKDFWKNGGGFRLDTLLTIPYFGLMRLPKRFDTLSHPGFFRLRSSADNPLETSQKMLTGHVAMSGPNLADWYLKSGQTDYSLEKVSDVSREVVAPNCPKGLCFYTDGYPQIFPLAQNEQAVVSARTLETSPVYMASFREEDLMREKENYFSPWTVVG